MPKLIQCPVCSSQISESAQSCPKCGHPISAKTIEKTAKKYKGAGCFFKGLFALAMVSFMNELAINEDPTYFPIASLCIAGIGLIGAIIVGALAWWNHG